MKNNDNTMTFPQRALKVAKSDGAIKLYASFACIFISLFIGFIFLVCLDPAHAGAEFYTMLVGGMNFSRLAMDNFFAILAKAGPLLCCGLAVLFAYRAGMFNIGVAGQYVVGVFGSLMFALQFNLPWYVCILAGMLFGAIWGAIPGLLKAFCNVNETLAGIMLNWIGLYFTNYSFQTYLSDCVNANDGYKTFTIASRNPGAAIPDLGIDVSSYFSISIFIAVIVAVLIWFIMKYTTFGYQLRASGLNKHATKYAGMNEKRNIVVTLAIAGALAGLGASLYYLSGLEQWQAQWSNSLPQVPWNGIVVGFVAQLNPIGAIFASLFICLISHGSRFMMQIYFPSEVADFVVAIIVYLCGLTNFAFILIQKYRNKRKHKDIAAPPDDGVKEEAVEEEKVVETIVEEKTPIEAGEGGK